MTRRTLWPDYCNRVTLAKRLDLAANAIDMYVARGILPPPLKCGDALLWRWTDVDAWLSGQDAEPEVSHEDPYLAGVDLAAPASSPRKTRR